MSEENERITRRDVWLADVWTMIAEEPNESLPTLTPRARCNVSIEAGVVASSADGGES